MSKNGVKGQEQRQDRAVAAQQDDRRQGHAQGGGDVKCPMFGEPAPRVCDEQARAGFPCSHYRDPGPDGEEFCRLQDPAWRAEQRRLAAEANAEKPGDERKWQEERGKLLQKNLEEAVRKVGNTEGLGQTCCVLPPGYRDDLSRIKP